MDGQFAIMHLFYTLQSEMTQHQSASPLSIVLVPNLMKMCHLIPILICVVKLKDRHAARVISHRHPIAMNNAQNDCCD